MESKSKSSKKNYGFPKILFLYFMFSMFTIISDAVELDGQTITATQSLTDGQTMVSSDRTFELGFFSPSGGSSRNRYLGIWFKRISNGTVVWVANRDTPLTDTSGGGVLKITDGGILVLVNSSNTIFWSSSNSSSSSSSSSNNNTVNPVAQLLDSGNLVVKDVKIFDANHENFLWQSFDYPCDTLLPGMKLGKNLVTGIDRRLWSWKSSDDPSKGDNSYGIDLRGYPQFVLLKGSVEQSRTGPWNGLRFSGSVGLKPNSMYEFHFVFDQQEVYYGFELLNSSVFSRLVLNPNGIIQRLTWNYKTQDWTVYVTAPVDSCDFYGLCQAYGSCNIDNSPACGCLDKFMPRYSEDWNTGDWSSGCVRRTPLDCHNGSDGFLKYSGVKLPDTRYSWFNSSMTLKECEMVCLKNCSCMAYANIDIREGGSGCFLWFGDLIDIRDLPESGQDIYIRMAFSELDLTVSQVGSNRKKRKEVIIIMPLLAGVFVLGLTLTLYVWKKKHQQRKLKREGRLERGNDESHKEDLELPMFDLSTIANATNNFSIDNKLGEGGFGPVYKGMLEEGKEIAVKRMSKYSTQGVDELKNEVICIAKLQHRNLVKLLGCCIQGEEKMLIYEYMPNKSLDLFLFDQTRSKLLDWPKRFDIINGIARGLLYLHQDSRLRIIHRDLKASNILLDVNMIPKISDFGVARSFGENETRATTRRVVGTHGYMSPEYAVDGIFSVKSDVFSFGVLVLEMVSGKKNRGFFHTEHNHNLLGHSWKLFKEGRSLELVDAPLGEDSCCLSQILRSIHIALLCVQQSPYDRPNMSFVVLMLGSEGALLQPNQPGFYTERSFPELEYYSSSKQTTSSVNEITMTVLEAR